MNEALQAYIGKECYIATASGMGDQHGIVKSIEGNWLTLMSGRPGAEKINTINTDFIVRILEMKR